MRGRAAPVWKPRPLACASTIEPGRTERSVSATIMSAETKGEGSPVETSHWIAAMPASLTAAIERASQAP